MTKKIVLAMLSVGALASALSARSEYLFCAAGYGRGVPFAITHPAHGPELLQFPRLPQGCVMLQPPT